MSNIGNFYLFDRRICKYQHYDKGTIQGQAYIDNANLTNWTIITDHRDCKILNTLEALSEALFCKNRYGLAIENFNDLIFRIDKYATIKRFFKEACIFAIKDI